MPGRPLWFVPCARPGRGCSWPSPPPAPGRPPPCAPWLGRGATVAARWSGWRRRPPRRRNSARHRRTELHRFTDPAEAAATLALRDGQPEALGFYLGRQRVHVGDPSETKTRLVDAERRKAEIEVALATATWRDPRRGELSLAEWAHGWLPTRLDLRPTTWARLETTMQKQVLPYFGSVPLNKITNAVVREWVSTLLSSGLSAATTRKAVFALRQCLAAAIADERIQINPACAVPLPTERQKPPRYHKVRSSV